VRKTIHDLEKKFGSLVRGVKREIESDQKKMNHFPNLIKYELPQRLKGLRQFIPCENSFPQFFDSLENMWNILDHDLLGCIIYAYNNDELTEELEEYEHRVNEFAAETSIYDLIKHWKPRYLIDDIPEEIKSCVTELSWDPKVRKVRDLKDIQMKLRSPLPQELAQAAFSLCMVQPGSVTILWLIYGDFLPQVMTCFKKLLRTDPNLVNDTEMTYLAINNVILYNSCYNFMVSITRIPDNLWSSSEGSPRTPSDVPCP